MKRLMFPLLVLAAIAAWQALTPSQAPDAAGRRDSSAAPAASAPADVEVAYATEVEGAFERERSGVMVSAAGSVSRLLSDDREGSRHQRFIVGFPSGRTVLVAHNIDLAPRVRSLEVGDAVRLRGQYEWNEKGGVIHWTHRDPDGSHEAGWIEHDGERYD